MADELKVTRKRTETDDLEIQHLAQSELEKDDCIAELTDRVVDLEIDNRALRETLKAAIDMLHKTNVQLDRARASLLRLSQELRDVRGERAA